ncbi:hypothetical protein O6H91_17G086900 [Diphasiastrum complanatum]|uniref:Uncharacterized protein n=1 Tax=Diphasiastrum complanatum TaxID=34168 RepID=A0ACC2B909_DIPCM|nr:hypothetical protein O6H91_17G086900 [Diphasiastrum complanatum]
MWVHRIHPAEMEGPNSADVAQVQSSFLGQSTVSCSVCLDAVKDVGGGERSIAKLKCGHLFRLDCIGSTFNEKGSMQCPNCRCIEEGQWLYANGSHRLENSSMDGLFAGIIDVIQSNEDYLRRQVDAGLHLHYSSPQARALHQLHSETSYLLKALIQVLQTLLKSRVHFLVRAVHFCVFGCCKRCGRGRAIYCKTQMWSSLPSR